ncbi:MAG TPA: hypothetical protein GXX37_06020 [Clostridiaceae bacterium]|nr:hypothetical protein [Clostridiaceae bacterium]
MFNVIKKHKVFSMTVIILGIILLCVSCQKGNASGNIDDIGLEPPIDGLSWGMTMEEAANALGVDKSAMEQISTSNGRKIFALLYDKEIMGQKPKSIQLTFTEPYEYKDKTMPQALVGITINYTIDKYDAILKKMKEQYGEPIQLTGDGAVWGSRERRAEFIGTEQFNIARDLNLAVNRIDKDALTASLNEQLKSNIDTGISGPPQTSNNDNPFADRINTITLRKMESSNETLLISEAGFALYIKQARELLDD